MRRMLSHCLRASAFILPIASCGLALASEEHGDAHAHAAGVGSLWPYVVNFVLLLALLRWKGRAPVNQFLAERKEKALADLRAAERARDEARAKLAEYEGRLSRIDADVQSILNDTLKLAEGERARIIRDAEAASERIRSQATLMVEQEVRRARQDLAAEVTDAATREATAMLRGALTGADQDRLVNEFVQDEPAEGARP